MQRPGNKAFYLVEQMVIPQEDDSLTPAAMTRLQIRPTGLFRKLFFFSQSSPKSPINDYLLKVSLHLAPHKKIWKLFFGPPHLISVYGQEPVVFVMAPSLSRNIFEFMRASLVPRPLPLVTKILQFYYKIVLFFFLDFRIVQIWMIVSVLCFSIAFLTLGCKSVVPIIKRWVG